MSRIPINPLRLLIGIVIQWLKSIHDAITDFICVVIMEIGDDR